MIRLALLAVLAVAVAARESTAACPRSPTWDAFARCNLAGKRFKVLRDLASAKLVEMPNEPGRAGVRLALYVRFYGAWMPGGLYSEGPGTELLGFEALGADTYRIETGHVGPQWITLDQASMRLAWLRQRYTHVCTEVYNCQRAMTTCDVLVHGKRIAGYRGEAFLDGTRLKVRADMRAQSRYCATPRDLVEEPS